MKLLQQQPGHGIAGSSLAPLRDSGASGNIEKRFDLRQRRNLVEALRIAQAPYSRLHCPDSSRGQFKKLFG
ncbi:MAG: hypothetical protein EBR71_03415 [Planctomycetes bacterium]|nr:hypothetical protein [Planctomycetota bacterium]